MSPLLTIDDLHRGGYDTVIVAAPDMVGRLMGKRLSPRKLEAFVDRGVAMSACTFGWDVAQGIGLEVPYAGWHTGWHDVLLMPDLATLRPCAWLEGTALVLCDLVEEGDHRPLEIAPRRILQRQLAALAADGYEADVGTELEFYLYRESYDDLRRSQYRELTPTTLMHADYTVQQVNTWEPFFRRLRRCLDDSGLDVELSQGEWGLGQWEINLTYGDALGMADRHAVFKLAVHDVAAQAGLSATFMPKPSADTVGSSCHVHLSLREGERHAFFDPEGEHHAGPLLRHAVAGLLTHATPLMAWYAPTVNAYRRTSSSEFAGHGLSWGWDNRTVSCRVLGDSPASTRLEWRVPGADVNPYLAVAGVVASVRDGIARRLDPGQPFEGDAYQAEVVRFPEHLGLAAEAFVASAFNVEVFGPDVVEHYGLTARYEWAQFLAAVTDWERERYLELI
jgi:glutamine synthetase